MKLFSKVFLVSVVVLMLVAPVCGGTKSDANEPILLKFASWMPPRGINKVYIWWFKELERLTNNRIKIDLYWSASMIPAKEELGAIEKGIADIAMILPSYTPGRLPLWTVINLPGIFSDMWAADHAFRELAEVDVMKAEMDKYNAMYFVPFGTPHYMLLSTKPVTSLKDFKGLKVKTRGYQAQMINNLGGVPVSLPTPELYTALERGTIDAAFYPPASICLFKIQEVAKYYTPGFSLGGSGILLVFNKKTWNKLPEDIKEIIHTQIYAFDNIHYYAFVIRGDGDCLYNEFPKAGVKQLKMLEEDKEKIKIQGGKPIWDFWVEKMEKKGLPGKRVLETWQGLIKKWEARSPYKAMPISY